jgi:hypothetical protein
MSTSTAFAGVIADCYADAESDFSGLSVSVNLGQTTVLTSSSLAAVFDKVAELHTNNTLTLQYNTAGRNAMRQAMSCIFDAEVLTLSAVFVNQTYQQLNVRQSTGRIVNSGNQVLSLLEFNRLDASTCSRGPVLRFTETSATQGGHSMSFTVAAFGSNDYSGAIAPSTIDPCNEHPDDPCTGECLGECDEGGGETCECHGGIGECSEDMPGEIIVTGGAVFQATY